MAYRMPSRYSKDADYDSQDDEASVDISVDVSIDVGAAEDDESEAEGSFVEEEYSDDEYSVEEDPNQGRVRRGHGGAHGGARGHPPPSPRGAGGGGGGGGRDHQLPRRAKSFDGDTRFGPSRGSGMENDRQSSSSHHDRRSTHSSSGGGGSSHSRGGSHHRPSRSNTFNGSSSSGFDRGGGGGGRGGGLGGRQVSLRSMGGPKMRRDTHARMDKDTIASNRARRLRAMGEQMSGEVKLVRRSQSFRGPSSSVAPGDDKDDKKDDNNAADGGPDEGQNGGEKAPRERKPPRRSISNDLSSLPPEERQYARTAARGVTRSKSLKAQRPNLETASKNVATRLQAMRKSAAPTTSTYNGMNSAPNSRYRKDGRNSAGAAADSATENGRSSDSPKAVALQW